MDANFTTNQAMSAKMPELFCSMFTRLLSACAIIARIDYGTRKPLSVPECHNPLGYGTGTRQYPQNVLDSFRWIKFKSGKTLPIGGDGCLEFSISDYPLTTIKTL
jgi:hypothetical protein